MNKQVICDCSSLEHQVALEYDNDSNIVTMSVFLKHKSFFNRLKLGIKYIFGYKCKYGNFDEFIISEKNINDIRGELRKIKCNCKNCKCNKVKNIRDENSNSEQLEYIRDISNEPLKPSDKING